MPEPMDDLKRKIAAVVQSLIVGDDEAFQELLGSVADGLTVKCRSSGPLKCIIEISDGRSKPRTFIVATSETGRHRR